MCFLSKDSVSIGFHSNSTSYQVHLLSLESNVAYPWRNTRFYTEKDAGKRSGRDRQLLELRFYAIHCLTNESVPSFNRASWVCPTSMFIVARATRHVPNNTIITVKDNKWIFLYFNCRVWVIFNFSVINRLVCIRRLPWKITHLRNHVRHGAYARTPFAWFCVLLKAWWQLLRLPQLVLAFAECLWMEKIRSHWVGQNQHFYYSCCFLPPFIAFGTLGHKYSNGQWCTLYVLVYYWISCLHHCFC